MNNINTQVSDGKLRMFSAVNPVTGKALLPVFTETPPDGIDEAVQQAGRAFEKYRRKTGAEKALFLEAIGQELRVMEKELIARCSLETALTAGRLESELTRTINQLKLFAELLREGSWINARIDRAQPERQPLPRSDIRQMQVPLGPVGIFGASNFPFAFSVSGGDTVSALAAGCSVVVKAHPAHPGTSEMTAKAVLLAAQKTGMPEGILTLVQGSSSDAGMAIVNHPLIQAIGFTGSTKGGLAIAAAAAARPVPIPVYAEMGSTNPVFILPAALREKSTMLAKSLAASATLGVGQFCTNPGIVVVMESAESNDFLAESGTRFAESQAGTMLSSGISQAYQAGIHKLTHQKGAKIIAAGNKSDSLANGTAYLLHSTVASLLADPSMTEEIFGPSSLVVTAENKMQLLQLAENLTGHLTATVHALPEDLENFPELLPILERKVGRIILNGFPTGVEVCHSMVHGGPFPATTDSRTTSVGTAAIYRFTRPVCYQDFPGDLLPTALRDGNPLKIWRLLDGEFTKDNF